MPIEIKEKYFIHIYRPIWKTKLHNSNFPTVHLLAIPSLPSD